MRMHRILSLFACVLLAACGGDKTNAGRTQEGEQTLPRPAAAGGSVTGMPDPGVASAVPAPASVPSPEIPAAPESDEPVDDTSLNDAANEVPVEAPAQPPPPPAPSPIAPSAPPPNGPTTPTPTDSPR